MFFGDGLRYWCKSFLRHCHFIWCFAHFLISFMLFCGVIIHSFFTSISFGAIKHPFSSHSHHRQRYRSMNVRTTGAEILITLIPLEYLENNYYFFTACKRAHDKLMEILWMSHVWGCTECQEDNTKCVIHVHTSHTVWPVFVYCFFVSHCLN